MDIALSNDFNLAVDRLSQYVSTRSPNVNFVRGTQGRGGRNISSVTGGGRGGGRGRGRFGYGQGEGGRFGYGKGEGGIFGYERGRGGRGGSGGCSGHDGCGGGRGGRSNHNIYYNNVRQNHNHEVDTSDLTRNFTPEEVSALIQTNLWDNICAERSTKRRRINNNDDGDITARVNALGSTIKTLQDTVSQITDNQTGGENHGGNNAQTVNGGVNNRYNSGNFGGSARRHGAFSYMTTARVATTNCIILIMFQNLKILILWHIQNQTLFQILLVLERT